MKLIWQKKVFGYRVDFIEKKMQKLDRKQKMINLLLQWGILWPLQYYVNAREAI